MEKLRDSQQQGKFLPYYFNYIGRGISLLGLILFFSHAVIEFINPYVGFGLMLTGLFLFAFAKERIGNEILIKKSQQHRWKFLPHYFKYTGRAINLLGGILFFSRLVVKTINICWFWIGFGLILIGALFSALAKEKAEVEIFMKRQNPKGLLPPFPNYFKKIGAGTVLFTVAVLMPASIWLKDVNPAVFENYKSLFRILFIDLIYIGFLLYIGSREKIEDELIVKIRLNSLAFAFIMGILWVIMQPVINFILSKQMENIPDQGIVLFMLVFYTIIFHFSKRNR
jgi:hypothetical protein